MLNTKSVSGCRGQVHLFRRMCPRSRFLSVIRGKNSPNAERICGRLFLHGIKISRLIFSWTRIRHSGVQHVLPSPGNGVGWSLVHISGDGGNIVNIWGWSIALNLIFRLESKTIFWRMVQNLFLSLFRTIRTRRRGHEGFWLGVAIVHGG